VLPSHPGDVLVGRISNPSGLNARTDWKSVLQRKDGLEIRPTPLQYPRRDLHPRSPP